jgi:4-amino-4-deoxy-L-arabinose transferase-like glycosyltransferase
MLPIDSLHDRVRISGQSGGRQSTRRLPTSLATTHGWALFIFCLALLLRVCYALVATRIDPFLARDPLLGDAASYDRIARTLLAGGSYGEYIGRPSAFWPPLYPLFLAGVYGVFGHNLLVARLLQAVLGALLPLFVFLIGVALGQQRVARLASLGAALYPYAIYFGAWLISESLYFALLGLMLWYGMRLQQQPTYRRAVLFGLIIGAAVLTKPTTLFQLPFLTGWFLFCFSRRLSAARIALGAVTALSLALVLLPWSVRNYTLFGAVVIGSTNGGYTFYGANNPDAFGGHYENFPPRIAGLNEAEEQSEYYRMGLAWINQNPQQFAWVVGQKFARLVSPLSVASSKADFAVPGEALVRTVYGGFLLLALAGFVLSLRRWRDYALLYVPIGGVIVSTLLFYGDARYTLPAVPAVLIFAALALHAGFQRMSASRDRP